MTGVWKECCGAAEPEVEMCLACLGSNKETTVAGCGWARERVVVVVVHLSQPSLPILPHCLCSHMVPGAISLN